MSNKNMLNQQAILDSANPAHDPLSKVAFEKKEIKDKYEEVVERALGLNIGVGVREIITSLRLTRNDAALRLPGSDDEYQIYFVDTNEGWLKVLYDIERGHCDFSPVSSEDVQKNIERVEANILSQAALVKRLKDII